MLKINYFVKYMVRFLQKETITIEDFIERIKNQTTGCEYLNNYHRVSKQFLREVITFLINTGRINHINGKLYPTPYVLRELEENKDIFLVRQVAVAC